MQVPLEDDEQAMFVEYLELRGLRLTAVPNSTYTPSMKQKVRNHRLGLRAGFPDLIVLVPPDRSLDGRGYFLAVEMKRQKGGTLSPQQRDWIDAINGLNNPCVRARVCKGADEAISFVAGFMPKRGTEAAF